MRLALKYQTSSRECLLSFGAESFVFQFAIYKLRYTELQFCMLFCMGVKLGRSYGGRKVS